MAFGFSPKHLEEYQLNELSSGQFLTIAYEAAQQQKWDISFVSESGFIAYSGFSWSSYSEEISVKIDGDTAIIKSECTGSQLFDWGKNKKNIQTLISSIDEIKLASDDEWKNKYVELQKQFADNEEDILAKPPLTAKEKITDFFSIFTPTEGYFVSPILININILIFILMLLSGVHILMPENQSLLDWGANFRPSTLDGQPWRLFTSCFLHIGILHLLLNMYALLYIGILLEPYLGKTRFLSAYIISGLAASLTSLWWNDLTISAGASGAIFGMYGVFLAMLTTNLLDKSVKKALLTSVAVFVGYNLMNGLKPNSGIDNAAHIGGLISGLIIGYAFVPSLKKFDNIKYKIGTIGFLAIILIAISVNVINQTPNDIGQYEKEMERFVSMESMALEVYNLPEGTPDEQILDELKNRGFYYWKENIKLLNGFDKLDLPLEIQNRNDKLKKYCQVRLKAYKLIYKAIDQNSDAYQNEIDSYNQQIESIINELTQAQ